MFLSKLGVSAVLAAALMATPATAMVVRHSGNGVFDFASVAEKGGGDVQNKKRAGAKGKRAGKRRGCGVRDGKRDRRSGGAPVITRFGISDQLKGGDGGKKRKKKRGSCVGDDTGSVVQLPAPGGGTPVVPTPIPASGLLLLGGLAAMGAAARRRKSAS